MSSGSRDDRGGSNADHTSGGRLVVAPVVPGARKVALACGAVLQAAGHLVRAHESLREAAADPSDPEVAVIALAENVGGDRRGAELWQAIPQDVPLVLVGVPAGPAARSMIHSGAYQTVEGPEPDVELTLAVSRALRLARAIRREARFDPEQPELARQIGSSERMLDVHRLIRRAVDSPSPMLVIGEAGTGKHLVGRAVHSSARSRRRQGPFIRCPLSALVPDGPERVLEELYGSGSRPGLLEIAHGGTLFLDDIALLPESLQSGLVSLLETGSAATIPDPDGGAPIAADVRLMVGSSRDLAEEVSRGRLRKDLHYHLKVLPIHLPPLRERPSDVAILAGALVDRHARASGKTIVGLAPQAVALLQRYHWPGNVRELDEHLERAVRRAPGPVLQAADLTEVARLTAGRPPAPPAGIVEVGLALDEEQTLAEAGRRAAAAAEVAAIRRALKESGGNVTHAAKRLKVSRLHLQKRMKRYGLRPAK